MQKNQSTVFGQDNRGRTPLYYAAVAKDGGEVYEYLLNNGSDPVHNDQVRQVQCEWLREVRVVGIFR